MNAVFLDRDGTIIVDKGYITIPDDVELLPGAADAIARFRSAGWKVFVVSNQAGVAKGLISEEELTGINQRMLMMLGAEGALLDGIYCCPHHPEGSEHEFAVECGCRKPKAGLLEQAAAEHNLDFSDCAIVGDSVRDLEAGRRAGVAATLLVLTGHGAEESKEEHGADHVAPDLAAAAEWLLSR